MRRPRPPFLLSELLHVARGGALHLRHHFGITFPRVLTLVIDIGLKEIINFHIFKLILLGMFLLGQWLNIIYLFQYFGICVVLLVIGFSR